MDITAQVDKCFLIFWLVVAVDASISGYFALRNSSMEQAPKLLGCFFIKRLNYGLARMKQRRKDTWLTRLSYLMFNQKAMGSYFIVGSLWSVLMILSILLKP